MREERRRLMQGVGAGGPKQYTLTVYPTSLDTVNSVFDSLDEDYPISNAFAPVSSTTQGRVHWVYGSEAHTYVYLNFDDLSSIPLDARIISVECSARVIMTGTQATRWQVREMMLTSGTSPKSSTLTPSSNSAQTFADAGTWTAAELHNAKWMLHVQRRTSYVTTDYYLAPQGASLTVIYEV